MIGDLDPAANPIALFQEWLSEAEKQELNDPTAMALATVDSAGNPDVRMVLMRGIDERGFVFFTNLESAKGKQLAGRSSAALCFHWKSLRRQVRVRGPAEPTSVEEADAYFASRPRGSRIGAWASQQSRPLESRLALEKAVAAVTLKYPLGEIPRPPYWSGFRVRPEEIEFWADRNFRLHERLLFRRAAEGWEATRLYP